MIKPLNQQKKFLLKPKQILCLQMIHLQLRHSNRKMLIKIQQNSINTPLLFQKRKETLLIKPLIQQKKLLLYSQNNFGNYTFHQSFELSMKLNDK